MKKLYFILFTLIIGTGTKAQVLAWDFNGNTGSEVVVPATTSDPNLTTSQTSRGVIIATALANTYAATNWTTTNSLADAINNNSYYQFTVKANAGFQVSLLELNANFRRSATGPSSFQWRYSLDGSNFSDAGSPITYTGTENDGAAQSPINLIVIPALQNVNYTTTITFRLYGYNAADAAGSFAFGRLNGNDIDISGKAFPYVVVPIRLVSFNAVNNGNTTRLHWLVSCTSSHIKFEIQRAGADANYTAIYSSTETQARCLQPFDVNDDNTAQGINFYRLKMIDVDGRIAYSNTLQVVNKKTASAEIRILPTIVSNNANIMIPSDKNYTATILFIDNQGRQVNKTEAQLFKGTNNITVNTSDLKTGKYYLKVIGGTEKNNTVPFIKQ